MEANQHPKDFTAAVQEYWEKPATVSIIDKNLHQLEIQTVLRHLEPTDAIADIGCGNGEATVQYAHKVKSCVGIERSNHLRAQAIEAGQRAGIAHLTHQDGDILNLDRSRGLFDAVVTQRLLINLASWEEQMRGLSNIHAMLKPGGRYIMIENTNDAFQAMNDMRAQVGLPPVPQHWHNRFFDHDLLMEFMNGKFQLIRFYDFGLYYFLTRVYVPMFASFAGYGANAVKDPIFEKSDAAARMVHELFADRIKISGGRAFGPIQVFVFRREA